VIRCDGGWKIEKLKGSDKRELLDLFTQAFEDQPLIPELDKPWANRTLLKTFIDFFGSSKISALHGIRMDGRLVCASLYIDSTAQPSTFAVIRFIILLLWKLGWRSVRALELVSRKKPRYRGRYIELAALGTSPPYQMRGLGRRMLRFLREKAKEEKYKGMILLAEESTPAFDFYTKEGFVVDEEFRLGKMTLCWMRLELMN